MSDAQINLTQYEIANLREALKFLGDVGGDTGDWFAQVEHKLSVVDNGGRSPNKHAHQQKRDLAVRVGWRGLFR